MTFTNTVSFLARCFVALFLGDIKAAQHQYPFKVQKHSMEEKNTQEPNLLR